MDTNNCKVVKELPADGGIAKMEKLEAKDCCSITVPFHALQPGKYTVQAKFSYAQGEPKLLTVTTEVGSTIEATLNLGVIMIAYTLTRLTFKFYAGG